MISKLSVLFALCALTSVSCILKSESSLVEQYFEEIETIYLYNIQRMHEASQNFNILALEKQREIRNKTEHLLSLAEKARHSPENQDCVIKTLDRNVFSIIDVTGCTNIGYLREVQSNLYKISNILRQVEETIAYCDAEVNCIVEKLKDYKDEANTLDSKIFQTFCTADLDTQKCIESTGNGEIRSLDNDIENLKKCIKQ